MVRNYTLTTVLEAVPLGYCRMILPPIYPINHCDNEDAEVETHKQA